MEKKENQKHNIKASTIILLLIILGLISFIVWERVESRNISIPNTPISNIETSTPESTTENTITNEIVSTSTPTIEPSTTENETNTSTASTSKNLLHFNSKNGKNTPKGITYSIDAYTDVDDKTVTLSINSNNEVDVMVNKKYSETEISGTDYTKNMKRVLNKTETIKGFSTKVDEILFGEIGQDITGTVALFLMNDGTVEYIGLKDLLQTSNLKSRGKLKGLNNIVRLQNVDANDVEGGGARTAIAIDTTGSFYDIGYILSNLGIKTDTVN